MSALPTAWYCPECGDGPAPRGFKHLRGDDGSDTICPGTHVKCVVIPPGTPLPVILDMLGYTYIPVGRAGVLPSGLYVTISPATGEAHDGSS
jgi:hypothetical protein